MADLPIMPVKTDAILADTTHMSPEEFGVYCRLLFVMWRQEGKLPDDDSEMATIGGVTGARWRTIKEKVMRPMTVLGGVVTQKRLTDTWMKVQEKRRKLAGSGDKGRETQKTYRQLRSHLDPQMPPHPPPQNDLTPLPRPGSGYPNKNITSLTTSSDDAPREGSAVKEIVPSPELRDNLKRWNGR